MAGAEGSARVVHALPFDHARRSAGPDPSVVDAEMRLRDLANHARLVGGDALEVGTEVVDGVPGKALVGQPVPSRQDTVLGSVNQGRCGAPVDSP